MRIFRNIQVRTCEPSFDVIFHASGIIQLRWKGRKPTPQEEKAAETYAIKEGFLPRVTKI